MALAGDLQTFSITTILQLLHNDAKTGILRIWRKNAEVTILVEDGAIIYAMKSQHDNRLGHLLKKQGLIFRPSVEGMFVIRQKE